jgi:hypothetical protein
MAHTRQQWLRERASILRYTYIASLALNNASVPQATPLLLQLVERLTLPPYLRSEDLFSFWLMPMMLKYWEEAHIL